MTEPLYVLAFYKYVTLEDVEGFQKDLLATCQSLGLMGRILVAEEGMNGSISGTKQATDAFVAHMHSDDRFSDMAFKTEACLTHPFKKMNVKKRKNVLNFGAEVDLRNTGTHLSPKQFLEMYEQDDVVILDARNTYEAEVGKFKNAITPQLRYFRDFPKLLPELTQYKDKKVVMYCTGGIRCEKASAFLKENGFKDVYQLEGGIINFGKEFPDTVWEGKCFVFDKRLLSDVNVDETPQFSCSFCGVAVDHMRNCSNVTCDKLFIVCPDCKSKHRGCCSVACLDAHNKKNISSD